MWRDNRADRSCYRQCPRIDHSSADEDDLPAFRQKSALKLAAQTIEPKHAPPWQLTNVGHRSADELRALAWTGREKAREALRRIKHQLREETRRELIASRSTLPALLKRSAQSLQRYVGIS